MCIMSGDDVLNWEADRECQWDGLSGSCYCTSLYHIHLCTSFCQNSHFSINRATYSTKKLHSRSLDERVVFASASSRSPRTPRSDLDG